MTSWMRHCRSLKVILFQERVTTVSNLHLWVVALTRIPLRPKLIFDFLPHWFLNFSVLRRAAMVRVVLSHASLYQTASTEVISVQNMSVAN